MIKLNKDYIRCLAATAPQRKNISCWDRGVKEYAVWLIDKLPDDYCMIFDNQQELKEHLKIFTKLLLNGAESSRDLVRCTGSSIVSIGKINKIINKRGCLSIF